MSSRPPVDGAIYQEETTGARYLRKSKENPFIPIGAFATVGAFVMSVIKWREGNSLHMQYWMRARVGLQASTVAAFVIGAWLLGETKQQRDARAQAENEAQAVREQAEFRERMKAAEEAQRLEDEMNKSKWLRVFGSGKGGAEARQAAEAQKLSTPPEVTSAPAGEANVHAPVTQGAVSSTPAGEEKVRTPVADALGKSGGWSWFGGSGKK